MRIGYFALFAALTLGLMTLQGCGGSTGWRVSFGVAPVTAISDRAELSDRGEMPGNTLKAVRY